MNQMTFIACLLSGILWQPISKKLQESSHLGEKVHKNSILPLFEDGYYSVEKGKLVPLASLTGCFRFFKSIIWSIGLGYSALNTARSSLSVFGIQFDGIAVGCNVTVII